MVIPQLTHNARYTELDYSRVTIKDKTLKSLFTQRCLHIANHVYKVKSKFESLGTSAQDLLLKPYAIGHAQKHGWMFCNKVVVLVSAHQFHLFFNSLMIKTGFVSSFYLFETHKQRCHNHRTMYVNILSNIK